MKGGRRPGWGIMPYLLILAGIALWTAHATPATAQTNLVVSNDGGPSNVLQNSAILSADLLATNGNGLIVTNGINLSNLVSGAVTTFINTNDQLGAWNTNVTGLATFNGYAYEAWAEDASNGLVTSGYWSPFTTHLGYLVTNYPYATTNYFLVINTNAHTLAIYYNGAPLGSGSTPNAAILTDTNLQTFAGQVAFGSNTIIGIKDSFGSHTFDFTNSAGVFKLRSDTNGNLDAQWNANGAVGSTNPVLTTGNGGLTNVPVEPNNVVWNWLALYGSDSALLNTNSIYYGIGMEANAPQPYGNHAIARVTPDPMGRVMYVIGNPPVEDVAHVPNESIGPFNVPGTIFLTNPVTGYNVLGGTHAYVHDDQVYPGGNQNCILTEASPDFGAASNDWQYIGNTVFTDAWLTANGDVSSPCAWVNPVDQSLWTIINYICTNSGNWSLAMFKRDSTLTNYTGLVDIFSNFTGTTTFNTYSPQDPWIYSSGGTNWVMANLSGASQAHVFQNILNWTTNCPPTNGFSATPNFFGAGIQSGGGAIWQDANGTWWANEWTTSGQYIYQFAGNNPVSNAVQVSTTGGYYYQFGNHLRRATTTQEVADVTAGYLRSTLINAPLAWYQAAQAASVGGYSLTLNSLTVSNNAMVSSLTDSGGATFGNRVMISNILSVGSIQVGANVFTNTTTISTSVSFATNTIFLLVTTNGAFTMTLPSLPTVGQIYDFVKVSSDTNVATVSSGSATKLIGRLGETVSLTNCDDSIQVVATKSTANSGTNYWAVLGNNMGLH